MNKFLKMFDWLYPPDWITFYLLRLSSIVPFSNSNIGKNRLLSIEQTKYFFLVLLYWKFHTAKSHGKCSGCYTVSKYQARAVTKDRDGRNIIDDVVSTSWLTIKSKQNKKNQNTFSRKRKLLGLDNQIIYWIIK